MSPGQKLRQILEQPGILVLPGVYDCIGAKIVEQIGFSAVFTSCLLYTSPSPRDPSISRMPSSA